MDSVPQAYELDAQGRVIREGHWEFDPSTGACIRDRSNRDGTGRHIGIVASNVSIRGECTTSATRRMILS